MDLEFFAYAKKTISDYKSKAYFITLVDKWQCQIIMWDWKILKKDEVPAALFITLDAVGTCLTTYIL